MMVPNGFTEALRICPVVATYALAVEDVLDTQERPVLESYITRLIGTKDSPAVERVRKHILRRRIKAVTAPNAYTTSTLVHLLVDQQTNVTEMLETLDELIAVTE